MDREKVIKGLETVWICDTSRISNLEDEDCISCPYRGESGLCNGQQLADDALALLQEQKAVKPIEVFRKDTNCYEYHCKRCGNKVGTILGDKHSIFHGVKLSIEHFCDVCGQAVKWE